jgi:hypothetical protein
MLPAEPSDDDRLAAAGSSRHGRVLVTGTLDGLAVVVADANDDGALFTTATLVWHDGAWQESGWGSAGILAEGWAHGVAYAYGRTPDADAVEVALRGEVRRVPVNEHGWWLVLAAAQEHERFDLTPVPGVRIPRGRTDQPPRIAG